MTPAATTLVIMIHQLEDENYEAGRRNGNADNMDRITKIRESRQRLFDFLRLMTEEDLKSL